MNIVMKSKIYLYCLHCFLLLGFKKKGNITKGDHFPIEKNQEAFMEYYENAPNK